MSDIVVGIELLKDNAINDLAQLVGSDNILEAKRNQRSSIRGQFAKDNVQNAVHLSNTSEQAIKEIDYFFN